MLLCSLHFCRTSVCALCKAITHVLNSSHTAAGYGVLHGPILIEEQESRSGTSILMPSFCTAVIDNVFLLRQARTFNLSCDLFRPPLTSKVSCILHTVGLGHLLVHQQSVGIGGIPPLPRSPRK